MYKLFCKRNILLLTLSLLIIPQAFAQKGFVQNSIIKTSSPTIQVEKRQYKIDEFVTFDAIGFERFEQISIFIKDLNSLQKRENVLATWIVFADTEGKSTFQWRVPSKGNYEITAIGNKNYFEARTTISSLVPTPVKVGQNPTCKNVNASTHSRLAHIASDFGFKVDGNISGTYPFVNNPGSPETELSGGAPADAANSVNLTITNGGKSLQWSSTRPITAVIVKGGNNDANVYPYAPNSLGDAGPLTVFNPNQEISHVTFCFQPDAKIIIKKHATPPSDQKYDFTASPGLTPNIFHLVDDSPTSDPMRMFTVDSFNVKTITETFMGTYTLRSIDCTVDIGTGGTPAPIRTSNSIAIDIKPGDQVTCTFNNDFLTAASVSVSGRVFDLSGRGLSRAGVSITDLYGNVRMVTTNSFGYFRFEEIDVGETYVMNVRHKYYNFNPQTISINEDILGLNFYPRNPAVYSKDR